MKDKTLLKEQAIVFEAIKTGDWDSPAMNTLRSLRGRGRVNVLVDSLAALGLCDRQGVLKPEAQQLPDVKPDARLVAATSRPQPKPKPDAK